MRQAYFKIRNLFSRHRMCADQHFSSEFFGNADQTVKNFIQTLRRIDIFGAMQRDQKIFEAPDIKFFKSRAVFNFSGKSVENFFNRIARNKNSLSLDSLAD